MTPRIRDDDEDWLREIMTRLVRQLEESWLRLSLKQLEDKTTSQHSRVSEKTAILGHRVDALRDEMHVKYLSIDKFNDWIKLDTERSQRTEDRQKLLLSVTKWAAAGGGFGVSFGWLLKLIGAIK